MSRKISTREWTMIVVLALAGLIWLYTHRDGGTARADGSAGLAELDIETAPIVNLASLERQGVPYDGEGRSLFKYYVPPPPPRQAPPPRAPVERPKPQPPVKKPPPRKPQATRTATIPPPKPNFDYLGYLGPKDNKIAVFEDKEAIMLARTGDVVRDQFVVRDFKYEGVVLGFTDKRFEGQSTELGQLNVDKGKR